MEPKHGGLAIMIAGPKAKKSDGDDEDEVGALDAMKAFMAACKDDDPEAALEEFRNLLELTQEMP